MTAVAATADATTTKADRGQSGSPLPQPTVSADLMNVHRLQSRWALWYLKADRQRHWEDCLKQIAIFDTVEDFWALYNHIQPATGLSWGSDYYLFKEGIKPMWEDLGNVRGGRWFAVVDKQKRQQVLDDYWLELLMALIGEQFDDCSDHICGASVNVRQKGDKVSLWTRDSQLDDVNLRIGNIMKAKLALPDTDLLRYELHKDSSARTGSTVKPRLTIPVTKPATTATTTATSTTPTPAP